MCIPTADLMEGAATTTTAWVCKDHAMEDALPLRPIMVVLLLTIITEKETRTTISLAEVEEEGMTTRVEETTAGRVVGVKVSRKTKSTLQTL